MLFSHIEQLFKDTLYMYMCTCYPKQFPDKLFLLFIIVILVSKVCILWEAASVKLTCSVIHAKLNYALRVCIYLYLYLAENALYTGTGALTRVCI